MTDKDKLYEVFFRTLVFGDRSTTNRLPEAGDRLVAIEALTKLRRDLKSAVARTEGFIKALKNGEWDFPVH